MFCLFSILDVSPHPIYVVPFGLFFNFGGEPCGLSLRCSQVSPLFAPDSGALRLKPQKG